MAKRVTTYELALPARSAEVPTYQWLYKAVRSEILGGRLKPGRRLPATRDLARQYGLARGTIVTAFDMLASEGYVQGSVGSGTYVSRVLPEKLLHVGTPHLERKPRGAIPRRTISDYASRAELFGGYENRPIRAFRANLPALDLFPIALWTKITNRCLRRISTRQLMGCDPMGYMPLRKALAEYLNGARGVRCEPDQVAIVSGVQEALDLTSRILLNPGDGVVVENPGYPGAVQVFKSFGARVALARMDEEGLAPGKASSRGTRLIYVTPGHQFPLGTTMSLARRLQLLDWAGESGAIIFEDDYDSEFRYSGRPVPALQGLDERGLALYAGSFSKVLFPSLRLGYLVIPTDLLRYFEASMSLTVRHAPMLEQIVLAEFISEGHFGRHLRRMREVYAERLRVLMEEASSKLDGLMDISDIEAGLQTVGWLCGGIEAESASTAAAKRNIEVTPLSRYSMGGVVPEGLQLGFAALDTKEIRRGARELAVALEGERKATRQAH